MVAVAALAAVGGYALLSYGPDARAAKDPRHAVTVNQQGAVEIDGDALRAMVLVSRGDASPITVRPATKQDDLTRLDGASDRVLACQGFTLYAADEHQLALWSLQVDAISRRYHFAKHRRPGSDPCAFIAHVDRAVVSRPGIRRNPALGGASERYRYGDSNPGFRRERAAS